MEVNKRTAQAIFDGSTQFVAPLFQRPYVWEREDNWEPLWEAVAKQVEKRAANQTTQPHFMGAVVLEQVPNPVGTVQTRLLIDGQQRLTTIQVWLKALHDIAAEAGKEDFAGALEQLTTNPAHFSKEPEDRLKIVPTQSDRADFLSVISAGALKDLEKRYGKVAKAESWPRLPGAYAYFREAFTDALRDGPVTDVGLLVEFTFKALILDLHFVVIELTGTDDPQEIFETLNALGAPLLPADLVRNFLFHLVPDKAEQGRLFKKYWALFDERKEGKKGQVREGWWRTEVKQGRLKRPRLDLFLHHYLVLKKGQEIPVIQLFKTFKRFASDNKGASAEQLMADLRGYADVYQSFLNAERGTPIARFIWVLEQLDTSTVFPVLLALMKWAGEGDRDAGLAQALSDLESYLVRRQVCGLPVKQYNQLFADIAGRCGGEAQAPPHLIREALLESESPSTTWPKDREFYTALATSPVYQKMARPRVRLILDAMEQERRGKYGSDVDVKDKLTIEHLMPQAWQEHWPAEDGVAEEIRDSVIHGLGNLTLITGKLNPSISNGPWAEKRVALQAFAGLLITQEAAKREIWDYAAIVERAREFATLGVKRWPRPT